MRYKEYGNNKKDTIVLIHGGGLSWWNYRKVGELLQSRYHVVLPVIDGHADSDKPFTTIEDNAEEIIEFVDEHFNGHVLMIGGLSLGAQISLEIISQRKDICKYALIESAEVIPSSFTNALIAPSFSLSYGLIRNRTFAGLQFKYLKMDDELFEDYYRDTCKITKDNMIAFMKASTSYELKDGIRNTGAMVHIYAGEKETKSIIKSAEKIHDLIDNSQLTVLKNLYHGEFSINHPADYINEIERIIGRNRTL